MIPPRLYLDEDTIPELAELLRARGHDVLSAHDIGALGIADEEQMTIAIAARRALASSNHRDFRRIAVRYAQLRVAHWGIVLMYRQFRRDELGLAIRSFEHFLATVDQEILRDATLPLSVPSRQP